MNIQRLKLRGRRLGVVAQIFNPLYSAGPWGRWGEASLLSSGRSELRAPAQRDASPYLSQWCHGFGCWMFPKAACLALALLLAPRCTAADPLKLLIGSHELSASDLTADLFIQNISGAAVPAGGLNLFLQVGDGSAGPRIGAVDLLNGTVFDGNYFSGQAAINSFTLPTRTVGFGVLFNPANGTPDEFPDVPSPGSLIARVTFDLTGVLPGTYDFDAATTFGDTSVAALGGLGSVGLEIVNGSVTLDEMAAVPEPSGAWAATLVAVAAVFRLLRRDRKRALELE